MKFLLVFTASALILSSCSQRLVYHQYSDYIYNAVEKDCNPAVHKHKDKLKVNTKLNYITAFVSGEDKKMKITSYEYQYNFISLFHRKKDRRSLRIECENGYKFYIEYGMFAILTMPDDGDEDVCDDTIFYDLISK